MTKTVHVAAGIIQRENGEILAVQRGYGPMAGLWEFPGGKVEHGETPAEACERELREELDVRVTNLRDFYTLEYDYPDFHLSMTCFFCQLAQDEAEKDVQANDGQQAMRWVHTRSLATLTWMPADIELVELLSEMGEEERPKSGDEVAPGQPGLADEATPEQPETQQAARDVQESEQMPEAAAPTSRPDENAQVADAKRAKAKSIQQPGAKSAKQGDAKPTKAVPAKRSKADKPARAKATKRTKKTRPKPDLLDGVDTSDLTPVQTKLVRRRAAVRKSMQGNKRRDTKPELLVRQHLREAGFTGYRLDWAKAPGRPDIAFPGRKLAIFVNGCYWHRCPHCNPSVPRKNVEFWQEKFRRNVARDKRALEELHGLGWRTITIWECELKRDRVDATMKRVLAEVQAAFNDAAER